MFLFTSKSQAEKPPCIMPWLEPNMEPLTNKLLSLTGEARIECLKQGWGTEDYWDKQVLDLQQHLFKREILMHSHQNVCWYAKTIIPEKCYYLDHAFFDRLKHGILTPLIFNEPKVRRRDFFTYSIDKHCMEWYWIPRQHVANNVSLWVRFSSFKFLERGDFFLIEIFLPDFLELIR